MNKNFSQFAKLKNSLSTRLLRAVFSLYFLVAFIVTAIHIGFEYVNAKDAIAKNLGVFNQTFNSSLANSAWNMDYKQIDSTLKGILKLPDISGVMFTPTNETEEKVILGRTDLGIVGVDDSSIDLYHEVFSRSFPVIYRSDDGVVMGQVGMLTLFSHRSNIFYKIEGSLILIIFNALLKTAALSIFFIFAFRRLLAKPLYAFTNRLNNLNLHEPVIEPPPLITGNTSAELQIMDKAYLRMIKRIQEYASENSRLNTSLFELNKDLEDRVEMRTRQLHETQKTLLRAAHAAGMSQVTTEILHNVGNIVNSIVISVQSLKDGFTGDEYAQFNQVMRVLEIKIRRKDFSDLESIIEFVAVFGSKSKRDLESLRQVLESLQKFIVHLRHITEVQKLNSPDVAYESEINLHLLLQDTIYLSGLSNDSSVRVELHHESRGIPIFYSDEHRLMQVFVNLLVNAKQAVHAIDRSDKKILVSGKMIGGSLVVAVEDNGVGISPENLRKIFQSGYTTKSDGTGLGLHNSANHIKYLGGDINCFSSGENRGALFTISLPVRLAQESAG